jgi:hypothetical protein
MVEDALHCHRIFWECHGKTDVSFDIWTAHVTFTVRGDQDRGRGPSAGLTHRQYTNPMAEWQMRTRRPLREPVREEAGPAPKNYITPAGLQQLKDEHRFLLSRERPAPLTCLHQFIHVERPF